MWIAIGYSVIEWQLANIRSSLGTVEYRPVVTERITIKDAYVGAYQITVDENSICYWLNGEVLCQDVGGHVKIPSQSSRFK